MKRLSSFLIFLFLLMTGSEMATAMEVTTLEIGSKAPDFNLPGVDGVNYTLDSFKKNDILVIIFTCNHCPTAQAYEQRIIQLVNDYKDKAGFAAISPNDPLAVRLDELGYTDLNDDFEAMKIRAAERQFNFPYLYDGETQNVSKAYGPVATPHVFIFDKARVLRYSGRIDDSERINKVTIQDTRLALDALLAGKNPPVEKTKTFGCSVKWGDKRDGVAKGFEEWAKENVTLEEINEKSIKELVKNDTGYLLFLNIWATWCGPCVAEFPHLVEINRMYRNREFKMVTLNVDDLDKKASVLTFLKKKEASTTNYISQSVNIYDLIEMIDPKWEGAIPHTLLIAPGGKIVYRYNGMISDPVTVKREVVNILGRVYK